jgi:N6-adenosine-specific RNA methylase IME4
MRGKKASKQPFQLIVADPPWIFADKLKQDPNVRRGSADHYAVMRDDDVALLGASLQTLVAADAALALWVPAAKLDAGLRVMRNWGFIHKTCITWVKTSRSLMSTGGGRYGDVHLAFGMGRYFRAATELCLFGVRGRFQPTGSHSERNVILCPALPHSRKPEELQRSLELMYPHAIRRLELFARRDREGWTCTGLECPSTFGEDVHATIVRLGKEIGGAK